MIIFLCLLFAEKSLKNMLLQLKLNLDVSEFEGDEGDDDIDDVDYRPQGRNRQSDNSAESSTDSEGDRQFRQFQVLRFLILLLREGVLEYNVEVTVMADHMSRNRFFTLRNSLKLVNDNDYSAEDKSKDKLWKVRPLIEEILKGCHSIPKDQKLSIDEAMLPRLKSFVVANPTGEVCDFDIYQGATTFPSYADTTFGLGEEAVFALTKDLLPGHIVYCDRYFTTETLDPNIDRLAEWSAMISSDQTLENLPSTANFDFGNYETNRAFKIPPSAPHRLLKAVSSLVSKTLLSLPPTEDIDISFVERRLCGRSEFSVK
ncbi:hypothetical protein HW555_013911 [Spodoptera exigua]|uniref:PiggyBac transposable element-derived protein domain-containing protein n=1 Tax=Spodoptera exigua TaxID=7107 RepID=A0A835G4R9_SPOEX|nr:hypothetical protein HW555_013911 [Spodoptera exigua]